LSVSEDDYSRNVLRALNVISIKSIITGLASHFLLYFHMYIIYVAIFPIEKSFGNERYTSLCWGIDYIYW